MQDCRGGHLCFWASRGLFNCIFSFPVAIPVQCAIGALFDTHAGFHTLVRSCPPLRLDVAVIRLLISLGCQAPGMALQWDRLLCTLPSLL